jgi:hypothetical protein
MTPLIKRAAIMAGMAFQADASPSSLHTLTGAVVDVTLGAWRAAEEAGFLADFRAWQHDATRITEEMLETDHALPFRITLRPMPPASWSASRPLERILTYSMRCVT